MKRALYEMEDCVENLCCKESLVGNMALCSAHWANGYFLSTAWRPLEYFLLYWVFLFRVSLFWGHWEDGTKFGWAKGYFLSTTWRPLEYWSPSRRNKKPNLEWNGRESPIAIGEKVKFQLARARRLTHVFLSDASTLTKAASGKPHLEDDDHQHNLHQNDQRKHDQHQQQHLVQRRASFPQRPPPPRRQFCAWRQFLTFTSQICSKLPPRARLGPDLGTNMIFTRLMQYK